MESISWLLVMIPVNAPTFCNLLISSLSCGFVNCIGFALAIVVSCSKQSLERYSHTKRNNEKNIYLRKEITDTKDLPATILYNANFVKIKQMWS
jgi:hypothetical protein